jgi:hypothetical protein
MNILDDIGWAKCIKRGVADLHSQNTILDFINFITVSNEANGM